MIARTSPGSTLQQKHQQIQQEVIHLATAGRHGAAATLLQSLSSLACTHSSSSARASKKCKTGPSSSYKTMTYENSLVSVTYVNALGTKCHNVGQGLEE